MKITKNIILIFAMIILILYIPTISNAALQANGKSVVTYDFHEWLLNVRYMEATGGTLGLSDTINTKDLTSSASVSNNLDIHMELNTEYGALALLSASAYGNPNKINDGDTTTGNKTGAYMYLNKEWVSAGVENMQSTQYINANPKYKNVYTASENSAKIGDATLETKGWHGSRKSVWMGHVSTFIRAQSGSIFSYSGDAGSNGWGEAGIGSYNKWYTRAVMIIGNGI